METPKDANEVNKALKTRKQILDNISRLNKEQQANFKASLDAIKDINAEEDKLNQLLEDTQDTLDKVRGSLSFVYESLKDSVNEMKKGNEYINIQKSALSKLSDIARTSLNIRKGENVLEDKKFKQLQEQAKQRREDLQIVEKKGGLNDKEKEALKDQIKTAKELEASMEAVLAKDKEILKNLGFAPKVVAGIDKAISKLGLPEMGLKDALDKTRMLGQATANGNTNFKAMSEFTGLVLKNIEEALSFANLLTLGIGAAVVALMDADKHTGELAKNMGVSYKEAIGFHHEMTKAANDSDYLLVTTKDLINAQMKLSDAIGTGNNLSKDLLDDFAGLTEQAGYSEEAMMAFGKIVSSTGGSLKDTTSEMLGQIELLNQQNGLSVNSKQLVEEISKTSAATVLTYGRSGEALAKAAFQAKQVGINLQQAENIADSLLNFESSIAAELEAELLTGKSLNLEKARQLALEGDVAGAAKEALKNIKSAEEFTKMNVKAQEALAKATGLSRDDLAKSLMEREALARLGKQEGDIQEEYNKLKEKGLSFDAIADKLGNKKLAAQLAANSAQEKFAAISDKLKEVFTSLVTPLLPVLQTIADIASLLAGPLKMIGKIVQFTVEWGKYLLIPLAAIKSIGLLSRGIMATQRAYLALKATEISGEKTINTLKTVGNFLTGNLFKKETAIQATRLANLATRQGAVSLERASVLAKNQSLAVQTRILAIAVKDFLIDKGKLALQYTLNTAKALSNTIANTGLVIKTKAYAIALKEWILEKTKFIWQSKRFKEMRGGLAGMAKSAKNIAKNLFGKSDKVKGVTKDAQGRFRDAKGRFAKAPKGADKAGEAIGKSADKTKSVKEAGNKMKSGKSAGIKENLTSLGDGLRAMAGGKVTQGIGNLALAGPALVLALPSIPFLLFIGLTPLPQISSNLENLSQGLENMSGGKILRGIGNLALAGASLLLALPSIPFLLFIGLTPLSQISSNLENLSQGLENMSGAKVLQGIGNLALAGASLLLALPSIPFLTFMALPLGPLIQSGLTGLANGLSYLGRNFANVLLGSVALGAVGLALGGSFALAMMVVKDVDPAQMIAFAGSLTMLGLTMALLGNIGANVILGAAAMGILALSLIPAAFAFSLLAGVDVGSMIAFSVALPLLALAAAGLGFLAPFIIFGSVALAALGTALIPAAEAFGNLARVDVGSISAFSAGIYDLAYSVAGLGFLAPAIAFGGIALEALGASLEVLSVGFSALESVDTGALISGLTGLASLGPGLTETATALFAVAGGMGAFALTGFLALPVIGALTALGAVSEGLSSIFGGGGEEKSDEGSMKAIEQKLDQLIAVVSKGGDVYIDGSKVGKTLQLASSKMG